MNLAPSNHISYAQVVRDVTPDHLLPTFARLVGIKTQLAKQNASCVRKDMFVLVSATPTTRFVHRDPIVLPGLAGVPSSCVPTAHSRTYRASLGQAIALSVHRLNTAKALAIRSQQEHVRLVSTALEATLRLALSYVQR